MKSGAARRQSSQRRLALRGGAGRCTVRVRELFTSQRAPNHEQNHYLYLCELR
jgi:hypothetical protein